MYKEILGYENYFIYDNGIVYSQKSSKILKQEKTKKRLLVCAIMQKWYA